MRYIEKTKIMALNIKAAIAHAGISQEELAKKTGIAQSTISKIVTGDRTPKNSTLAKIADGLGITMQELYDAPEEQIVYCPHCGGAIKISAHNIDK